MSKLWSIFVAALFISDLCRAMEPLASFDENSQGVTAVAFSPDGRFFAASGRDGLTRVWRTDKKQIWKILGEHAGWVKCLSFSQDGKLLATAGSDKSIKVWDTSVWRPVQTLTGHERSINAVQFSPDSKILASAGDDETVRIWDVETGKKIKTLGKHKDVVNCLSFYPDGKFLASGGADFKIKIWTSGNWKEAAEIGGIPNSVETIAFSQDGKLIAGSWEGTIGVWTAETGKRINTLRFATHIKSLSFVPGSAILAAAGTDKVIRILNAGTGGELRKLEGHAESVESVQFSPAGRLLVSGGLDSSVKLWEALTVYIKNADTPLKNSAGETLLTLREGSKVQIERFKDAQIYVRAKEHLKGWLSENDITFIKPDLRKPVIHVSAAAIRGGSLTIRGTAYDDVRVASVYVGEHFFPRGEGGVRAANFDNAFPFEGTVPLPPESAPVLSALDDAGREFSVAISTDGSVPSFKPRYGLLSVQTAIKTYKTPSRASAVAGNVSPGETLYSIGFQGEWYLLEDGSWVNWLDVIDQLAEGDEEKDEAR